jgi:hypothetical protein
MIPQVGRCTPLEEADRLREAAAHYARVVDTLAGALRR